MSDRGWRDAQDGKMGTPAMATRAPLTLVKIVRIAVPASMDHLQHRMAVPRHKGIVSIDRMHCLDAWTARCL